MALSWPPLSHKHYSCGGHIIMLIFMRTYSLSWAEYKLVKQHETFCFCCAYSQTNTVKCIFNPYWAVHPYVLCVCVLLEVCKAFLYTGVIMSSLTIFAAFDRWMSQLCNAPDKSFSSVVKFTLLDFRKKTVLLCTELVAP